MFGHKSSEKSMQSETGSAKLTFGYANIFQGQIGRHVKNQVSEIVGLYTDEITTCHIVIIFDVKKKCFSLIHADPSISIEDIQAEQSWVGSENRILIVKHETNSKALESKLKDLPKVTIRVLPSDKDAIAVFFKDGQLIPVIEYFSTEGMLPKLYNHEKQMQLCAAYKFNIMLSEIYGQLKINALSDAREIYQRMGVYYYNGQPWDIQNLSISFQKELNYPGKRLLFNVTNFCDDRNDGSQFTTFAEDIKKDVSKRLQGVRLTFKNVYMAIMKCFHEKEPTLSSEVFQQYYDMQCTELARFYCYINNNIRLLEGLSEQAYWVAMVKRYSQFEPLQVAASSPSTLGGEEKTVKENDDKANSREKGSEKLTLSPRMELAQTDELVRAPQKERTQTPQFNGKKEQSKKDDKDTAKAGESIKTPGSSNLSIVN